MLLAAGRRRAAAVAAGTFGLCTGIGALVAPTASQEYWSHLVFDTGRVGVTYISNQSPFGVVARLFGGPVGGWYAAVPVVVGITGVAVAACFARIGDYLAMTAATGLTMLLVCPISWSHHWVWALPALPVCGRGARRRDRVVVAGCYAVFLTGLPWWTPHDGGAAEFGWHGVTTLAADSYAVVGLVLLGSLSWLLVRPPRGSAELSSLKERGPVRQLAPHVARNA
jgi:alpha-1,2-mannosyltransferase